MKKTRLFSLMGLLMMFAFSFAFTSCSEDEPDPVEALITEFAITNAGAQGDQRIEGVISGTNILVVVPYETDLTALTTDITLSSGASVVPASGAAVNFTDVRSFVVTNGAASTTYQVTVEKDEPTTGVISNIEIVSATSGETYTSNINQTAKTITVTFNDLQSAIAVVKSIAVLPAGTTTAYSWGDNDTLDLNAAEKKITLSYAGEQTVYDIVANITEAGFDPAKTTLLLNKSLAANLVPAIIDDGNFARGAAFNGRYVFVVSRKDGNFVYYWDMEAPNADPKTLALPEAVVAGGAWKVSDVRVDGDNIYVSNMVNAANGVFKIYKWEGVDDETPEVILEYTVPSSTTAIRLGDAISIIGNPPADGYVFASNFAWPANASEFYKWSFNGSASAAQVVPIQTIHGLKLMGQYGRVSQVPGQDDLLLVTGAQMGIGVMDYDGDVKYETTEPMIQSRSFDPNIFEYNGGRYLTFVVNREWEGQKAWYEVINITEGADIVDALKALTNNNIANKRVFNYTFGGATKQWVGASGGVGFNAAGKPRILGFAPTHGFVVHEFSN